MDLSAGEQCANSLLRLRATRSFFQETSASSVYIPAERGRGGALLLAAVEFDRCRLLLGLSVCESLKQFCQKYRPATCMQPKRKQATCGHWFHRTLNKQLLLLCVKYYTDR